MSAVLDPTCLEATNFSKNGYDVQARLFFRGMAENGLLITDPEGRLKRATESALAALPTKHGQDLIIRWEELFKNKKKRVISLDSNRCAVDRNLPIDKYARELSKRCTIDGFITEGRSNTEDVPLGEYDTSNFEDRRRKLFADSQQLDGLPCNEIRLLFASFIRYAKWLRFYDRQLGKGKSLSNFKRGIEYVLDIWKREGYFASRGEGTVAIYTCEGDRIEAGHAEHVKKDIQDLNKRAYKRLLNDLVTPIQAKYPWPVHVFVNIDEEGIAHARHIEAGGRIIAIERGFDFLRSDGRFKRTWLRVDDATADHLKQYRELNKAEYLEDAS